MRRVVVESPYAGDVERNLGYLRAAMLDCFHRGEAPFASHMLYTQLLNDDSPAERSLGMEAGFAWGEVADVVVVYRDLGFSEGMKTGVKRALAASKPVEYRWLGGEWDRKERAEGGQR